MANILIANRGREFHFDRDDAPVSSFDDQVDLMFAPIRPQMSDSGFALARVDAYVERHERLEEIAEERAYAVIQRRNAEGLRTV